MQQTLKIADQHVISRLKQKPWSAVPGWQDLIIGYMTAAKLALIQKAECIPHTAFSPAGNGMQTGFFNGNIHAAADGLHSLYHYFLRDSLEIVSLTAGKNGGRQLVRLSGG